MKKICVGILSLALLATSATYASDGSLGNKLTPEQVEEVNSVLTMTKGQVLQEVGLIRGDSNGNLHSQEPITREELIVILVKLATDGSESFTPTGQATFTDVPKTHWAYKYVEQAYSLGITTGMGDGTFGVGQYVNYKQAVTFMMNVIQEPVSWETAEKDADAKYMFSDNGKLHPDQVLRDDIFELSLRALTYMGIGESKRPIYLNSRYTDMDVFKLATYVGDKDYWAVRPVNIDGLNDNTSWLYEVTEDSSQSLVEYLKPIQSNDLNYPPKSLNQRDFYNLEMKVYDIDTSESKNEINLSYTANIAVSVDEVYQETHNMKIKQGYIRDVVECNGEHWEYKYTQFYNNRIFPIASNDETYVFWRANKKEPIVAAPDWYPYRRTEFNIRFEMSEDGSQLNQATIALPNPDHIWQVYELEVVE